MDDDTTISHRHALGRALHEMRNRAGLTQKELAARSGTDDTYISRVEHGRIDVGWTTLLRLLTALDADLGDLAVEVEGRDSRRKR
jgi:transcriptional regulator with XRE-family HTH domain